MIVLPAIFQTRRLIARQPVPEDAAAIFSAYARDPEVCRFMVWAPHESVATVTQFVEECILDWTRGSRFTYVLTARDTGQLLGMLEARCDGERIEIGYVLARPCWGAGLMPEAIVALVRLAFASPGIERVQAVCHVDNRPSQRALEKSGFTREQRLDAYLVHPNVSPEPSDCYLYALNR